jgi:hypothetical protein
MISSFGSASSSASASRAAALHEAATIGPRRASSAGLSLAAA